MVGRRWLLGVIIVVPLLGIAASIGLRYYLDSELRSELTALAEKDPKVDASRIADLTGSRVCEQDEALPEFCFTYGNLALLGQGAAAALIVGLGLLVIIRMAGAAASRSRMVLLWTFGPGLYVTAITTILLIATHGVVAMATLWYAETLLIERIHAGLLIGIGLGAAAGILAVARNMFAAVKPAETFVLGKRIDRNQGRLLYDRIEKLAKQLGALQPQHIVVGLDTNFFVTEAKVKCLNGEMRGRTLFCSLALSRIMTQPEFDAVIGHELGHYKGLDTEFSKKFYPIYRGTLDSIASLSAAAAGSNAIAMLPALGVLSYFFEAFALAESEHGRERELAADREGASVATKNAMASALVKVHAFAGLWDNAQESAYEGIRQKRPVSNISKAYAELVSANANDKAIRGIGSRHTSHPTDSHPSLDVRLKSLGMTVGTVGVSSLNVSPENGASELFTDLERLEEDLSGALQSMMTQHVAQMQAIEATAAAG